MGVLVGSKILNRNEQDWEISNTVDFCLACSHK